MSQHPEFAQALERSISLADQLEQLLLKETAALNGSDPEALQALVDDKQQVLQSIEEETAQLQRLVEDAGQAFTPEGMDVFLRESDLAPGQNTALSERWNHLRELAARCKLMNSANAQSIERDRQRVNAALKIIRGEDDSSNVYTAQGYSQSGTVLGRTLSQA